MDPELLIRAWRYLGSGSGKGQEHRILTALGGIIVTSTLFTEAFGFSRPHHSWIGTVPEFKAQFLMVIP